MKHDISDSCILSIARFSRTKCLFRFLWQSPTLLCHFLMSQVLNSAVPRSTLLIASINMDKHDSKRQLRLRNGLVTRHAYRLSLDAKFEEI